MKKFLFLTLTAIFIIGLLAGCGNTPQQSTPAPTQGEKAEEPKDFGSQSFKNCVIVYSDRNPEFFTLANRLSDHIYQSYGELVLPVVDTASAPQDCEIILGDTNRCETQGKIMEYSVTIEGKKCRINAGGAFSAENAVEYLCETVLTGKEFVLTDGTYYETSFLQKSQEISDSTTARIMSANVLADAFADNSWKTAYARGEIFAGMLISYTPDVVGLQETDENWNRVLDGYLQKIEKTHGISYARHSASYENKTNYTSLLYRSDKFKVENSDVCVFDWWENETFRHNYHMRNISWAQFSSLENAEKTFIVANTHWSYRTEHADGKTFLAGALSPIATDELRQQCKNETNDFLLSLRQAYPETPMFLTGDFNTSLSFFTNSGWTPESFGIISEEAKSSGKALSVVPASGHFDHLFGAGNYTIRLYAMINDANQHSLLTDHPFVYADLTF